MISQIPAHGTAEVSSGSSTRLPTRARTCITLYGKEPSTGRCLSAGCMLSRHPALQLRSLAIPDHDRHGRYAQARRRRDAVRAVRNGLNVGWHVSSTKIHPRDPQGTGWLSVESCECDRQGESLEISWCCRPWFILGYAMMVDYTACTRASCMVK